MVDDLHTCSMNAHNFCNVCAAKSYVNFLCQLSYLNIPILITAEKYYEMLVDEFSGQKN